MVRYAITIFLSAFLLFLVQPLIGKYILPWFGGGAGVWTACLLFFQTVLLAGYAYAHGLNSLLKPRAQAIVHIILLIVAIALLPIVPSEAFKPQPGDDPTSRILLLLVRCLGLPFLMLSSTGPLLQAWFARTHPGHSPYRLYALSNAGSLIALVGYPIVMERLLTRHTQVITWSIAFGGFALLCAWCAVAQSMKRGSAAQPIQARTAQPTAEGQPVTGVNVLMWILLPTCASVMLLSATSQLSEEVAPIPLFWVIPLAVYLVSFIITFEWPHLYDRRFWGVLLVIAPWVCVLMFLAPGAGIRTLLAGYMTILLAVCMVCHGELYRLRPPATRLTAFYLALAAGGALGGAFVSLIAPMIFTTSLEYYLAMFGAIALWMVCLFRDSSSPFYRGVGRPAWLIVLFVTVLAGFLIRLSISSRDEHIIARERNFYGSLALRLMPGKIADASLLKLEHGRIVHGAQVRHEALRRMPVTYYTPKSGLGRTFGAFPKVQNRRIGVVGLGAGTVATWGQAGDVVRFYEIDPHVRDMAQQDFTFLADTPAATEIMMGDARLSLEREEPQKYDILVLDAFSGDAIPVHLLTLEAFRTYQKHVNDDGAILVNVTNRYLDITPLVQRLAEEFGLSSVLIRSPDDFDTLASEAHWMLLTKNQELLKHPLIAEVALLPRGKSSARLWTDEYASVLDAMR